MADESQQKLGAVQITADPDSPEGTLRYTVSMTVPGELFMESLLDDNYIDAASHDDSGNKCPDDLLAWRRGAKWARDFYEQRRP